MQRLVDDPERCYRSMRGRDTRFDGVFYVGVTSTGIFCRPSCPARMPRFEHCRFLPSAAAALGAGFRACKRCRPEVCPGAPEWVSRADVVARAVRLIADGVVDRGGVDALAARLGYSTRQVHRALTQELFERAENQGDAFQALLGASVEASRDLLYAPLSYYRQGLRLVEDGVDGAVGSPISNYDELNVRDIADRLDGLSAAEIRTLREYETRNKNRETLIEQFDRKLKAASA